MKLEIARGVFLLGALGIASLALAVWEQPGPQVLTFAHQDSCPMPRVAKAMVTAKPDHELLLFMFGLSQGMKPQG